MRRAVFLLSAVVMTALAAAAFATGAAETPAVSAGFPDAAQVNPTGWPITREPVTLTMFAQRGEENANAAGWAWLEKKTNVHIQLEVVPQSAYWEKAKIKLATNDMNDIMDLGEKVVTRTFADQGFFYPLDDLVKAYGTTTRAWMTARPNVWQHTKGGDGKTYGWPWTTAESTLSLYRHFIWVDRNWLQKVGLQAPTTTQQFYDMLVAFRDKDANGNGKADEIPFSSCTSRLSNASDSPLIMPWLSAYQWLEVREGKVSSPLGSAAFKDAVAFQARLYRDGLMYKESLTQDRATQWKINEQSAAYNTIGSFIGQHQNYGMSWESPKWKDYIALEPLEGPSGAKYGVWSAPIGRIDIVISASSKHPAAAFRWMDWLYSQEGDLWRDYGLEGTHWRKATPGELDIAGRQAKWTAIETKESPAFAIADFIQSDWGGLGGTDSFISVSRDPANLTVDGKTLDQVRYESALITAKYVQPIDQQWMSPPIPNDINEEYSIIKTNILDVVSQYTAQFITGRKDIARDWAEFQAELGKAGLVRYVELSQKAYDAFQKTK